MQAELSDDESTVDIGPPLRRRIVDVQACAGNLTGAAALLAAMRTGAEAAGADVRQGTFEPFLPHGVTCVLILAESHYTVSTWPEHRFAAIDACVCDPALDLDVLVAPLLAVLAPGRCRTRTLVSGR